MDQSLQDQKARQEQYQREMKPMIENVRIIDEKVKNLIDYSQGLDKRLQAEADERKKMGARLLDAVNNIKDLDIIKR